MAETEVGAADVRAAAGGIVDAVDAVVGRVVVADGIAAGAAGRAGEDTRNFLPRICSDQHGYKKGPRRESWPFCFVLFRLAARAWAVVCRPSGAGCSFLCLPHGLRRGL